jgi:hypothetical protein
VSEAVLEELVLVEEVEAVLVLVEAVLVLVDKLKQ